MKQSLWAILIILFLSCTAIKITAQAPKRCYYSKKLESLIPKIQKDYFNPHKISDKEYESLTVRDLLIYSFEHPEWYQQSCSGGGRGSVNIKYEAIIPSYLRNRSGGVIMSSRQHDALALNRDSTLEYMNDCITNSPHTVNTVFKEAIVDLKAFELIPTLITKYNNTRIEKDDFYILTTLALLMKNDYEPFLNSEIYTKMYPDLSKQDNIKPIHKRGIKYNHSRAKKIIVFANNYFEWKKNNPTYFIRIRENYYWIGKDSNTINPAKHVRLKEYKIGRYEITNKEFATFVESSGYKTIAEIKKDAFVFEVGLKEFEWLQDSTANWRFPNGRSQGGIKDKMNHPVTCISYIDALAYCKWANVRLPTYQEWEVASRGNSRNKDWFFGKTNENIFSYANIWKGKSHRTIDFFEDYLTTSPVGSFKPNQLGIYDIYGNVFEFCSDKPISLSHLEHMAVTRGGSWWCSKFACNYFNSIDIGKVHKEASFSNNGFRVVK